MSEKDPLADLDVTDEELEDLEPELEDLEDLEDFLMEDS